MFTGFFSFLSPGAAKIIGWLIAALTAIPLTAKYFIFVVEDGEYGYFMRGGHKRTLKNGQVKLAKPGVYLVIPIWRRIKLVSTKETPCDPISQELTTKDDVSIIFDITGRYQRRTDGKSMTRAILGVDNLPKTIVDEVTRAVTACVASLTYDEIRAEECEQFLGLLLSQLAKTTPKEVGVDIVRVGIQKFRKTDAQLQKEGQLAIAAALKENSHPIVGVL